MSEAKHRAAAPDVWFNDPLSFIAPEHLLNFVPTRDMTLEQQLNAALRFSLYYALLAYLVAKTSKPSVFFIPLVVAVITLPVYNANVNRRTAETFSLDSNSNSNIRRPFPPRSSSHSEVLGGTAPKDCTRPTRDNPFMNVLPFDAEVHPRRPAACSFSDPAVAATAEIMHDITGDMGGVVRDRDDVFGRKTSSRQFFSNPVTHIPSNQSGFANWLYGKGPVFKQSLGRPRSESQFNS